MNAIQLKQQVTVTCYGITKKGTRKSMIDFYRNGMMACEGSERERYETIYFQLLEGRKVCKDV